MKNLLLILCALLSATSSFGQTGKTVKLAAGLLVEPYIIESTNSGFETDIVKEAFALEGYDVKFIYQPLLRSKISFATGLMDGVITIKSHYPEVRNAFVSDKYITYYNVAVTLSSRNIKIDSIADLKDKKVDAFQQANLSLGDEFAAMAKSNPDYYEMANQKGQVAKLFLRRNDSIVLDRRIFLYYLKALKDGEAFSEQGSPFNQPFTYHNIFESSDYRIAFKNEKLRDSFNSALQNLKNSGRYKKIIEAYVKE